MSFFGFGQSVELELVLSDSESRRRVEHKTEEGKKEKYFLFYDGETVSGRVVLTLKHPNKRLEHQGIKVEFIGQIGEAPLSRAPVPLTSIARVLGMLLGLRVWRWGWCEVRCAPAQWWIPIATRSQSILC